MSLTASPTQTNSPAAARAPFDEANTPEFIIRPAKGWVAIDWNELFHYRELLFFLVWRDVKVRYKQTVLGAAWAILQPVINMVIFTVIFGFFFGVSDKLPQELKDRHIPYAIFTYAGVLPWMFFAAGVGTGGMSLLSQQNLLTKIYFPRLFVPSATIGAALVDTLISFVVLAIMMACWHVVPPWTVIFVPFLLLLTTLASLGMAFTLSSLTVTYRDFRFLVPFMVQCWMYISPVAYPLTSQKHPWLQKVLWINPMYSIINGFRSALLGQHWDLIGLGIAVVEITAVLFFGLYYFKKTERRFADVA